MVCIPLKRWLNLPVPWRILSECSQWRSSRLEGWRCEPIDKSSIWKWCYLKSISHTHNYKQTKYYFFFLKPPCILCHCAGQYLKDWLKQQWNICPVPCGQLTKCCFLRRQPLHIFKF